MPALSEISKQRLSTCHHDLQFLINRVSEKYNISILCGTRNKEDQEMAFNQGLSKLHFPESKHNSMPSMAVDVAPYPIDWNDRNRFVHMAGYIQGIAETMNIKIRWGGDWTMDNNFKNDSFVDLPHFELV